MTDLFDPTNTDPNAEPKSYWDELTGPGKKFDKTKFSNDKELQEAISKGKIEADKFIEFKNREFDSLRDDYLKKTEELNTRANLEELLDRNRNSQTPTSSNNNPNANVVVQQPALDSNQVKNIATSTFQEMKVVEKQQQNFSAVVSKLKEHWGENYQSVLQQHVAANPDLNPELVNDLAKKHPSVLIKTLGLDNPPKSDLFQAPVASQHRTSTFNPTVQKRTEAFYNQMKRDDPNRYYEPKTQLQRHNDAISLGEEFFDAK